MVRTELISNPGIEILHFCADRPSFFSAFTGIDILVVPDLDSIIRNQKETAVQVFHPEVIEKRGKRTATTEQIYRDFDPVELRNGLENLLPGLFQDKSKQLSIDVPCAFSGKFAKSLLDLGFPVRASDILPEWVTQLQSMGLEAIVCPAEQLPKLDSGNHARQATITFEPYPVFENPGSAWIFMLRETVNSDFGPICVESRTGSGYGNAFSLEEIKKGFGFDPYLKGIYKEYFNMSAIYGFPITVVDTPTLRFTGLDKPDQEAMARLKLDELLTEKFREIKPNDNNKVVQFSLSEWSQKLNCQPQELVDSIIRLELAKLLFDITPCNFAYLQPQDPAEASFFCHRRDLQTGNIKRKKFWPF
ncbi:hypothetical protein KKE48_01750 [Patescibacteria group bacterium]|nr:hypothetical protein [Patescibacteria group bacterium]